MALGSPTLNWSLRSENRVSSAARELQLERSAAHPTKLDFGAFLDCCSPREVSMCLDAAGKARGKDARFFAPVNEVQPTILAL